MDNYFLLMLKTLRQNEEILLYANILTIDEDDNSNSVVDFLESEYQKESSDISIQCTIFLIKMPLYGQLKQFT